MPSPAPPTTSWGRWAPTYIRPAPVIAATENSTGEPSVAPLRHRRMRG